jgi:ribonuclease P protein component
VETDKAVDDLPAPGVWLGLVVPKRHARRAVTRTLLKRQIRQALDRQAGLTADAGQSPASAFSGLARGLWVVRLRTPFDKLKYPSAASEALRLAAAEELRTVLADAARRVGA